MSVGDVAGLVAAIAFVVLVALLAVPLLKLGRVLDETRVTIRGLSDSSLPLIGEVTTTVGQANEQMEKIDTITTNAAQITTNASALTALFAATLGSPIVRVAAVAALPQLRRDVVQVVVLRDERVDLAVPDGVDGVEARDVARPARRRGEDRVGPREPAQPRRRVAQPRRGDRPAAREAPQQHAVGVDGREHGREDGDARREADLPLDAVRSHGDRGRLQVLVQPVRAGGRRA